MTATLPQLLEKLDQAATADQVRFAVEDIAAVKDVESVPILIRVLGYNNPGAAVAAVDGLIQIGEPAVLSLIELLDGYNYGARAWALRALSGIGDPRGMDLVVKASLEDFALSVRRAAARGVGTLHWEQFPPEAIAPAQQRAIETLIKVCDDPEWVVRYAAVTGLERVAAQLNTALQSKSILAEIKTLLEKLVADDEALAVQGRARLALMRIISD